MEWVGYLSQYYNVINANRNRNGGQLKQTIIVTTMVILSYLTFFIRF